MTDPVTLTPIAHIRSCYPERFGIPRQAGLVTSATGAIAFPNTEAHKLSLRGLENFSHLWVIFLFHQQNYGSFKPLVFPPRLGGKKTMGVYATRSPNRPNPIGMSAVELERVEQKKNEILVHIRGGDFLDGTPVLDLKPYIPYADAIAQATSSWAAEPDEPLPLRWSKAAIAALDQLYAQGLCPNLEQVRELIAETIAQDPRPAHERHRDGQQGQEWNLRVAGVDVFWKVEAGIAEVTKLFLSQPAD